MATKLSLAEQIQLQYNRQVAINIPLKQILDKRELFPLINQTANELLGVTIMNSLKVGSMQIPASFIASYSNIPVQVENGRSFIQLPVHPVALPRNIGVYSVVPQTGTSPLIDGTPYIPITQEEWDLVQTTDILTIGTIEGSNAYYVEGRKVYFITAPIPTKMKVKLLISDLSLIGDSEPYPITPEMEISLIERVLGLLRSNTSK